MRFLVVMFALALAGFGSLIFRSPVGAQDLRCSGFQTQDGAQAAFDTYPVRAAALDGDGDGHACEEVFGSESGDNGIATEGIGSIDGQDVDCIDLMSQEDAQAMLDGNPDDPFNLDPNGDGVACASLPSIRAPLGVGVAFAAARPIIDSDVVPQNDPPAATSQRMDEGDSPPTSTRPKEAVDAPNLTVDVLDATSAPAESVSTDEAGTHTITGFFDQALGSGSSCGETDSDPRRPSSLTDATVTVSDGANRVLAVGGVVGAIEPDSVTVDTSAPCTYLFAVPNVPVADLYVISVEGASPSGSEVGPATYSYVGLESMDWNVHLRYHELSGSSGSVSPSATSSVVSHAADAIEPLEASTIPLEGQGASLTAE